MWRLCFGFSLAFACALSAQEERPEEPRDDAVGLVIEVLEEGERHPRIPASDTEPGVQEFRLEGRRIRWRVDGESYTDEKLLKQALESIVNDPRRRVPDPRSPGRTRVPPIRLEPVETCRWNELVRATDVALRSKFEEIEVAGLEVRPMWWTALSVADPVRQGGRHVVPEAMHSIPDDDEPERYRTVFYVSQTGAVRLGEETVVRPDEPVEVDRLTPRLEEEAETALQEEDLVEDGPGAPRRLRADLLIHADCWAPWPVVRRVVRTATGLDPRFYRVKYATGEYDFEDRMKKGDRF